MYDFVVDTSSTYFLKDIYKDMNLLCDKYSHILTKQTIGVSVDGCDIYVMKLGRPSHKAKPSVLLTGGIHAREDFSVMLCMKMIEYYCYYYNESEFWDGYDVANIIDTVDMYLVPVANPDGLNIIHHGLSSSANYDNLKSMNIYGEDYTYWKANSRGVDLNKNFDDGNWQMRTCVDGTDMPCSDRFKGFSSNSEPETIALIDLCRVHDFDLMVSYHCSGDCVFWADSGTHDLFMDYDSRIIDEFCHKYIYKKTKISPDPKTYGCGFENWFRAIMKRPGFCIELSPFVPGGKQHPDNMFDELVWQYAKTTGLFFAQKSHEIHGIDFSTAETAIKQAAISK